MTKALCLSAAFLAFAAVPAHAQMKWTDKAFANVNFGLQESSRTLDAGSSFSIYGENGTLNTTQPIDGGALFDVSGGYRVWRNLAVGLGFSHTKSDGDITIAANIPDPNFFDRPRGVTGVASEAEHSENALHIQGTWMMPVTDKIDLGFSFGPSIFFVKQDVATAVAVTEPGPRLSSTTVERESKTAAGVNFGVDMTYLVTKRIGAGVLVRYTVGSVDLDATDDSLTVGGFNLGFGVRIRFDKFF